MSIVAINDSSNVDTGLNHSEAMASEKTAFYKGLEDYAVAYWHIHPYLSLTICTFGIFTNIVNIVILTKKKMRNPINCVLTGIAISDIITMIDYIPFVIHFYISTDLKEESKLQRYSYGWSIFMAIHSCLSNTTHTISIWLAVCMSAIRYVFIRTKGNSRWNLNIRKTSIIIICVYCLSIFFFIPNYILTGVVPVELTINNQTATIYRMKSLTIYMQHTSTINAINVWIFIVIGKFLPCFLICLFGGLLLKTLSESRKLSQSLKQTSCSQRMRAHKRTTIMLLIIILMFIIAELPSGLLVFVSVFVRRFFFDYYLLFADTIDALSLVNNAVNFIMYCSMSRQFRECLFESIPPCNEDSRGKYKPTNNTSKAVNTLATQL